MNTDYNRIKRQYASKNPILSINKGAGPHGDKKRKKKGSKDFSECFEEQLNGFLDEDEELFF